MIYRFLIISNEVDNFMREIQIDADAKFLELHQLILQACGYEDNQPASFTICEKGWQKGSEITLEEVENTHGRGSHVMAYTELCEFLEDEKQHMLYTFDPVAERMFFIELAEITVGKNLKHGVILRSLGNPPKQTIDVDVIFDAQPVAVAASTEEADDDFFGNEVDAEEIDLEGFDISSDV